MKTAAALIVAIVIPSGLVLLALLAWWERHQSARDAEILGERIVPPLQLHGLLTPSEANAMRATASARRAAAEYQHKRARQIETGVVTENRIRLMGGRGR